MANARKYAYGRLFPVAPAFTTGVLALEGQRRVLECMIDERADGSAFWLIVPSSFCFRSRSAIYRLICPWLMWVLARRS